jgi:CheY-like chemotaxis protein/HPt (histidine-containing phosphotransfer) domain-containing protein
MLHSTVPVRSMHILVAEDNKTNQAVIRAVLAKAGHRVDIVGNGIEAVSAVMRDPYDLVLMDIQMPEMDGVAATRKIRALPSEVANIPIIALAVNAMKGDRESYLASGMTDYVPKPIDPDALKAVVAKWAPRGESLEDERNRAPAEETSVDTTPILDHDVLDKFADGVGLEMMPDLVGQSVADMRVSLARIMELGNSADLLGLRRAAHDLKSNSGGFGALRLQRLAQALDLACKADREGDARWLVSEIEPVAQEAFAALEAAYVSRPSQTIAGASLK